MPKLAGKYVLLNGYKDWVAAGYPWPIKPCSIPGILIGHGQTFNTLAEAIKARRFYIESVVAIVRSDNGRLVRLPPKQAHDA